jgi:ACS family tartrate transporter-like MFS transporter
MWTLSFIYFSVIISFYGISLWLPQIVQSFSGMSDVMVGFVSAVPYLAATVGMVIVGRSSDSRGERPRHVAASAIVGTLGLAAAAFFKAPAAELAALTVAAVGIWGTLGPFWAMSSRILTGAAAAGGIALINSIGNLGGFAGPYLIGVVRSRTNSFTGALIVLALFPLAGAIVTLLSRGHASPAKHSLTQTGRL